MKTYFGATLIMIFIVSVSFIVQPYDLKASIVRGKEAYAVNCQSCHMENGEGVEGVFPPVAKADYMKKDVKHLIEIVLKGMEGEITVNGKKYSTPMAAQDYMDDGQIADVYNYIRNSWGSKAPAILPSQVAALRTK